MYKYRATVYVYNQKGINSKVKKYIQGQNKETLIRN